MRTERPTTTDHLVPLQTIPLVSIIIPAYNAEQTLTETLESVRQQTFQSWEVIVVDDGSRDATVRVGEQFARCEPRVRVLQQPNGGASVARNTGIAQARGVWLLFLDADDMILPDHLANLIATIEQHPEAGAAFTGWAYMTPDNRRMKGSPLPETGDLFAGFAHTALFAIHACLVRRDIVLQAGAFDPSLRTCEDWDLWQRIARIGITWVRCEGETAIYRMRPHSLSRNVEKMLSDGLKVVETGFSPDARVRHPARAHADGLTEGNVREAQLYVLVWVAAEMLGLGLDARPVLHHIPYGSNIPVGPSYLADSIFAAVVLTRCLIPADWPEIWPEVEPPTVAFLRELEERVGAPRLVTRTMQVLEQHILDAVASPDPLTIGGTQAVMIEVTEPIAPVTVPADIHRLRVAVMLEGDRLGEIDLPVFGETVPSALLSDAITEQFSWQVLERFFTTTVYPHLSIERRGEQTVVSRGDSVLLELPATDEADVRATLHERVGWSIFLQELWDRPGWLNDQFYDPATPETVASPTIDADDRGWVAVELSDDLPAITTDGCVQVVPTVAGVALGAIEVTPRGRTISPQQLRAAISMACGLELGRACAREALIGGPLDGPSLRERLRALAGERPTVRQIATDGTTPLVAGHIRIGDLNTAPIYARRQAAPSLTAISRLASIPAVAAGDLHAVTGQSIAGDGWYVPEIVPLDVPAAPVIEAPVREPVVAAVAPTRERPQPPVVVKALRRVARKAGLVTMRVGPVQAPPQLPPSVEEPKRQVVTNGMIPVLMYHRVAPDGAKELSRYRVTPAQFEEQLAYLREHGYESASVEELLRSIELRQPLPGRRVVLTFDDAYTDFAEYAWPLLKQYGFGAILFVVSGHTGGTNEWDQRYGEVLPLLGWDALRELQADGVTIGAHSVTHPPMSGLSPREVAYEAAESRRTIERELGIEVQTFAYPYGDRNQAVDRIVGATGIPLAFSTRSYLMHVNDAPLSLPRVEVQGNDPIATFARNLTG